MKKIKIEELQQEIADYIKSRGGSAIVVGPAEALKLPSDQEYNYRLCFQITGKMPKKVKVPDETRR